MDFYTLVHKHSTGKWTRNEDEYFLLKMGISHWYVIQEGEISAPRGAKPSALPPGGRSIVALAAVHGQHVRNARLLGCEPQEGRPEPRERTAGN